MSLFHDHTRLAAALAASTLSVSIQNRVMEQARPAVAFVRCQHDMSSVLKGCSRLGGLPDWPLDKSWPMRKWRADAFERINILENGLTVNTKMKSMQTSFNPEQDAIYRWHEAKLKALKLVQMVDFPLAFVAQLNLDELSLQPGFDPKLPKRGLLSFFIDITWEDIELFVFWHDVAIDSLGTLSAPQALIELHDKIDIETPWHTLTQVECLEPRSVITVPAACFGNSAEQLDYEYWYTDLDYKYLADLDEEDADYFGDLLGGWSEPINHNLEEELGAITNKTWRLLFSWSEKTYANTALLVGKRVYRDGVNGTYYSMIMDDDLSKFRFDRSYGNWQFD